MATGCAFMVMPRSRSRSMESRSWSCASRFWMVPVRSRRRSERVVFPWSMCAMMQKFRVKAGSGIGGPALCSPHTSASTARAGRLAFKSARDRPAAMTDKQAVLDALNRLPERASSLVPKLHFFPRSQAALLPSFPSCTSSLVPKLHCPPFPSCTFRCGHGAPPPCPGRCGHGAPSPCPGRQTRRRSAVTTAGEACPIFSSFPIALSLVPRSQVALGNALDREALLRWIAARNPGPAAPRRSATSPPKCVSKSNQTRPDGGVMGAWSDPPLHPPFFFLRCHGNASRDGRRCACPTIGTAWCGQSANVLRTAR